MQLVIASSVYTQSNANGYCCLHHYSRFPSLDITNSYVVNVLKTKTCVYLQPDFAMSYLHDLLRA